MHPGRGVTEGTGDAGGRVLESSRSSPSRSSTVVESVLLLSTDATLVDGCYIRKGGDNREMWTPITLKRLGGGCRSWQSGTCCRRGCVTRRPHSRPTCRPSLWYRQVLVRRWGRGGDDLLSLPCSTPVERRG